jgi:trehalose/maltose hydrolase-like predicted phosphorylase
VAVVRHLRPGTGITSAVVLVAALAGAPAAAAPGGPDQSWDLSTTDPVHDYHPTFVGNGYLGARVPAAGNGWSTAPIATQFELAGLYSTPPGTTAVKPSLPAWSTVDVSDGSGNASDALAAGRVTGYRQSLDLRTGTLTTTARWTSPSGNSADLRYQVVTDRARPHVAAVRLDLVPHWSGTATVTDAFDDRAAEHLGAPVSGHDHTDMWETRQAIGNDTKVGIASHLDAPGTATPDDTHGTGQRVALPVRSGQPVTVTKYVGIANTQDSPDPLATGRNEATTAAGLGWSRLGGENDAAWRDLWRGGIGVSGDDELQRQVRASQFYLLASVRAGSPWAPSPAGLSSDGYNGHVFWDNETWMFPSVLAQHPDIAASILDYRVNRLEAARQRAASEGYKGARFPWESALSGLEDTPSTANTGIYEQHISSDVALAVWQYWITTGDRNWLRTKGFPILQGVADFWASRVAHNADGSYSINGVTPPDEYHENINDSVYTNVAARDSLNFATQAAGILGTTPNSAWHAVANGLRVPFDQATGTHPEFAGYTGDQVKQADVVMLSYPWENDQSAEVTRNDMNYYVPRTDPAGPSMTDSIHSTVTSELGDPGCAAFTYTKRSVDPFTRAPFEQFAETRTGGAFTFLTGAGGFLQEFLYGYSGLRWRADSVHLDPALPPQLRGLTLPALSFQGRTFTVDIGPETSTVRLQSGPPLPVETGGKTTQVGPGSPLTVPTRRPDRAPTADLARCAPVTSDSTDPSGQAIAAVDGDAQTSWLATAPGTHLTVDLRHPDAPRTLTAHWSGPRPAHYTVSVSIDGKRWTPVADVGSGGDTDQVDLGGRPARFVQLTVDPAQQGAALGSLEVTGRG